MKKIRKVLPWVIPAVVIASLIIIQFCSSWKAKNYQYTMNDIYYQQNKSSETFNVKVDNIRKEKGKEDTYEFSCTQGKGLESPGDFSYKLPKPEYDQLIGLDYNSVSCDVYELELAVKSKNTSILNPFGTFIFTFQRYSLFGEHEFTDEEIKQLAEKCLDAFDYANHEGTTGGIDSSMIPKVSVIATTYLGGSGDGNYVSDMNKLTT